MLTQRPVRLTILLPCRQRRIKAISLTKYFRWLWFASKIAKSSSQATFFPPAKRAKNSLRVLISKRDFFGELNPRELKSRQSRANSQIVRTKNQKKCPFGNSNGLPSTVGHPGISIYKFKRWILQLIQRQNYTTRWRLRDFLSIHNFFSP